MGRLRDQGWAVLNLGLWKKVGTQGHSGEVRLSVGGLKVRVRPVLQGPAVCPTLGWREAAEDCHGPRSARGLTWAREVCSATAILL